MIQPLVALDIGSTKVACAIGLPHESSAGFELLGSSVVAYPAVSAAWLGDVLMVSRTIEQALEATAVTEEFHRALVAMNPPGLTSEQAVAAVTLGDEPVAVRAHDLDRAQGLALDRVLGVDREPLLAERLSFTGNGFAGVRDPRGRSATRLVGTFHVVTMPMAARQAIVQVVESAGLEVAQLSYTLPATFAAAADEAVRHERVLVVDAGGLTTDLGLFVEGALLAAEPVAIGGVQLATAVATQLRVTVEQAMAWSVEGTACRRREVRTIIATHWETLKPALERLLAQQPRPNVALLSGRGALIDGFAEWMEHATGVSTAICRPSRTARQGDLGRQLGLNAAIGLLEMATQEPRLSLSQPQRLLNRVLDRTRTILTEYF